MTAREQLIQEIEQAPDDLVQALLMFLRQTQADRSPQHPSTKHYPLRGLPLTISPDFDASMPDLWDALGE